jgi:hypothetical protein
MNSSYIKLNAGLGVSMYQYILWCLGLTNDRVTQGCAVKTHRCCITLGISSSKLHSHCKGRIPLSIVVLY